MKVSVIIPAINEARQITGAIESAWAAGANDVVVADGGSEDETATLAADLHCRVVPSEPGRGPQQNAGAEAASGEVFVFLHADCRFTPSCLEQVRFQLQRHPRSFGGFRQQLPADRWSFRWLEAGNALRARVIGLIYGDQGLFLSRSLFESVGRFPNVPLMEDVMISQTLRRSSARRVLLPGPLLVSPRRWEQHGVVRQTLRNWSILAQYYRGVPVSKLAKQYRRHDRSG